MTAQVDAGSRAMFGSDVTFFLTGSPCFLGTHTIKVVSSMFEPGDTGSRATLGSQNTFFSTDSPWCFGTQHIVEGSLTCHFVLPEPLELSTALRDLRRVLLPIEDVEDDEASQPGHRLQADGFRLADESILSPRGFQFSQGESGTDVCSLFT